LPHKRASAPSIQGAKSGTFVSWHGSTYHLRERPPEIVRATPRPNDAVEVEFVGRRTRLLQPRFDSTNPADAA